MVTNALIIIKQHQNTKDFQVLSKTIVIIITSMQPCEQLKLQIITNLVSRTSRLIRSMLQVSGDLLLDDVLCGTSIARKTSFCTAAPTQHTQALLHLLSQL